VVHAEKDHILINEMYFAPAVEMPAAQSHLALDVFIPGSMALPPNRHVPHHIAACQAAHAPTGRRMPATAVAFLCVHKCDD